MVTEVNKSREKQEEILLEAKLEKVVREMCPDREVRVSSETYMHVGEDITLDFLIRYVRVNKKEDYQLALKIAEAYENLAGKEVTLEKYYPE